MVTHAEMTETTRWDEISEIWRGNVWLLVLAGWFAGILTVQGFQMLGADAFGFLNNLVPEAVGIVFTVVILERFAERREQEREREEIRQRLIREMGSRDNATARRAAREANERGMVEDGSLRRAILTEASMEEVDLSGGDFESASLWLADLSRARLARANFENASLERTELDDAFLYRANLKNTFLQEATLENADLDEANLTGAHLREANLEKANLQDATLYGAFLYRANLLNAYLNGAKFDEKTVLPDAKIIGRDEHVAPVYDKYWTADTDMKRYTDPTHRNFWQPDYLKRGYRGRKPRWLEQKS